MLAQDDTAPDFTLEGYGDGEVQTYQEPEL